MISEKFIIAGGYATRIKYYGFQPGDGDQRPVILLLHGYLESLDVWDEFAPLLRDMRVVAMDIPGHGISEVKGDVHTMGQMAGVVAGVAEYLGLDRYFVCGHSMGGYVACEVLARHPERLAGIIMFHSTPNADTDEKKEQRQRQIEFVLAGKKDLLAPTIDKMFAEGNRKRFADVIEDLKEQVVLTEEDGIVALLRGMMQRVDHNGTFRESAVPQLFIMGSADEHIPLEASTELKEEHPQARFVYLPASGHIGFIEEPETSVEILSDFIAGV